MSAFALEKRIFAPRHVLGWTLFTASAGFVNAGAVVASKNFVSHITGSVTSLANDGSLANDYAFVVAMFIGGAMLAVLVAETFRARPLAAFAFPIFVSFLTLLAISVAGKAGAFGEFGGGREEGRTAFAMLGALAAAMGMVNASVAAATANQIRVTHLTGPATDLAGHLVRAALGAGRGSGVEFRWAALRFVKLVAFAVGAGAAARLSSTLRYDVFAVAAGVLVLALALTGAPEASAERAESAEEETGAAATREQDRDAAE